MRGYLARTNDDDVGLGVYLLYSLSLISIITIDDAKLECALDPTIASSCATSLL